MCERLMVFVTANSTNNYSYIWTATRENYRESGCVFELEPLYENGLSNPPNLTSVLFGVNERYSGDPAPTDYNFGGAQSTSTAAPTSSSSPTSTPTSSNNPSLSSESPTSATISPSPQPGLTSAQKAGLGVGVSLGVLLLCSLGFIGIWYRRRIKYRRANGDGDVMEQQQSAMKAGMKSPGFTNNRISGTETLVSELSSQNYDESGNYRSSLLNRPTSELMGNPRAEME